MDGIIDLRKEQDLEGCVCAPVLLQEIIRASSEDIKKPVMTMLNILGELAFFVLRTNNPTLRMLALRLGLFPMSQKALKEALENEMERAKQIAEKKKTMQGQGDGQSNSVANG